MDTVYLEKSQKRPIAEAVFAIAVSVLGGRIIQEDSFELGHKPTSQHGKFWTNVVRAYGELLKLREAKKVVLGEPTVVRGEVWGAVRCQGYSKGDEFRAIEACQDFVWIRPHRWAVGVDVVVYSETFEFGEMSAKTVK